MASDMALRSRPTQIPMGDGIESLAGAPLVQQILHVRGGPQRHEIGIIIGAPARLCRVDMGRSGKWLIPSWQLRFIATPQDAATPVSDARIAPLLPAPPLVDRRGRTACGICGYHIRRGAHGRRCRCRIWAADSYEVLERFQGHFADCMAWPESRFPPLVELR